ncbi:hypothetical protein J7T55_001433 [Diaporthe amygdali]|uniref:uncharacterized protein n=1 Tax=Phomopsis amygdali TaxID=1214568 RepID=UPI0022FDD113|nr:uncharacterized protein J7T55_001433 [Diaporthe amygdali]KAJ0115025.1 hypothetical protein J7T55_001433 [Diaporthe amygdali]
MEDPKDIVTSPTFMVPFQHVEQLLIIDEPSSKENGSSTGHGHRVIIVPTAAVGASALKRTYPKIISFMLPDSKSGSNFKGKIGEAADDPQETYRSLITRVFNEQLAPFKKSVIDASAAAAADEDSDARLVCDVVLEQSEDEGSKEDVKGLLFFLETGVLFHSQTTVLYLASESTPNPMLVYNYEALAKRPGPANISLICRTTEPYYDKAQDGEKSSSEQNEEPLLISFHGIGADLSDGIARYAERHGIKLEELEQEWYDLEQGQPASGWMPRGFASRTG